MYPKKYYGETQWKSPNVTFDLKYDSNDEHEDFRANRIQVNPGTINQSQLTIGNFMEIGPGEYMIPCDDGNDSDKAIGAWLLDRPVYVVNVEPSELEPLYESDNLWDYSSDPTPIANNFPKEQCTEINIGDLNSKKL